MGLLDIEAKLDKIIELLELRNSLERARGQMRSGAVMHTHEMVFNPQGADTLPCNCGSHKAGELTGGWECPVHGHCF